MIVERLTVLPSLISRHGKLDFSTFTNSIQKPTVVRLCLNDPNNCEGYDVASLGVPACWGVKPIMYRHDGTIAWEWPYDQIADKLYEFVAQAVEYFDSVDNVIGYEMGIFGQWGEWTHWRLPDIKLWTAKTVDDVLDAYKSAKKPLMARSPYGVPWDKTSIPIGIKYTPNFYDDVLCTDNSNKLQAIIDNLGLRDGFHGGEIATPVQRTLFTQPEYVIEQIRRLKLSYLVRPWVKPETAKDHDVLRELEYATICHL